jgi:transketolase
MQESIKDLCTQVRRDILRMVFNVQSGHPGGSLGCVEFFVSLYNDVLDYKMDFSMDGKGEDLFFLSNGHISPVWYSVMARKGMFPVSELNTFRKLDTRLQGHPTTAEHLEGVRVASGSLGQGLSVACGAAMSKKMEGDTKSVFVLMGDGELQEGQIWEAALFAAHNKVSNLIGVVDFNGQQIDGPVSDVLGIENLQAKWESFGWHVLTCDGNHYDELTETLKHAKTLQNQPKPIIILMKTIMVKGVDFMDNNHKWHGSPPNQEQMNIALAQLNSSLSDF